MQVVETISAKVDRNGNKWVGWREWKPLLEFCEEALPVDAENLKMEGYFNERVC